MNSGYCPIPLQVGRPDAAGPREPALGKQPLRSSVERDIAFADFGVLR